MKKTLNGSIPVTFIEIDTRFYPCGGKRELIKAWQKQRRAAVSDKEMLRTCFFTDSTTMFLRLCRGGGFHHLLRL